MQTLSSTHQKNSSFCRNVSIVVSFRILLWTKGCSLYIADCSRSGVLFAQLKLFLVYSYVYRLDFSWKPINFQSRQVLHWAFLVSRLQASQFYSKWLVFLSNQFLKSVNRGTAHALVLGKGCSLFMLVCTFLSRKPNDVPYEAFSSFL